MITTGKSRPASPMNLIGMKSSTNILLAILRKMSKLSYEDIEPIVEYLVKVKSREYTFDCWDTEDIGQEIRIICFNALEKFEQSKAVDVKQITNYFGRCVDNRLKNLKRDKYIRFTPSLSRKKISELSLTEDGLQSITDKLDKFQADLTSKINIKHPVPIDLVGESDLHNKNQDKIEAKDIATHIHNKLCEELKPAFVKMINGDYIAEDVRIKVQASVSKIIKE